MTSRAFPSALLRDLAAGAVVFLVALPLCLGIAEASGAEPLAGLVSGIVGGIVVALLSGSSLSVSGPAAGLVVIVVDGIGRLGSFSAFLIALLLSGVIQFGFGTLRAGQLASYVPTPVIKGMLAAIGLLLIIKQIPLAVGLTSGRNTESLAGALASISPIVCTVAAISLAILAAWDTHTLRRFALVRFVPAPLVVVVAGVSATLVCGALGATLALPPEHRVALPAIKSFAALGDALHFPEFGLSFARLVDPEIWIVALTLAVVASLETLLSLEAVEQIDPQRRVAPPNRELKAQGVGNMVAGVIGGLPITSVIVRSSANVHAGARSRLSAIVHGALLLVSMFALTDAINLIPLASLAAILIQTGFKLARPSLLITLAKQGAASFTPFIVTIIGVLAIDLLTGIVLGVLCSAAFALWANLHRPIALARHDDHFLLSFRKDVSFLGKVALKEMLAHIPDRATLIVDTTRADFIDHDVRELLDRFIAEAPLRSIAVEVRDAATVLPPATRSSV